MTPQERTAIETAYGLLWLAVTDDQKIHEARRTLLTLIDKDGQKRGIALAVEKYGHNTPEFWVALP